jgi:hypothetical protein
MSSNDRSKEVTTTVQRLAQVFVGQFEHNVSLDGQAYTRLKAIAPIAVKTFVRRAMAQFELDDTRINLIYGVLSAIAECGPSDDVELDTLIGQHEALEWLSSNIRRCEYVRTAVYNNPDIVQLNDFNVLEVIRQGYMVELWEIYEIVNDYLQDRVNRIIATNNIG